jgi:hypothetical protein
LPAIHCLRVSSSRAGPGQSTGSLDRDSPESTLFKEIQVKIAYHAARLLLGMIFLFFGSNLFLNFLHAPMPTGVMGQFSGALFSSHYIYAVGLFQVVPAILLLINRYVPLALALLAPVIVNICLVHILMAPSGLPVAGLVVILWLIVFYRVRSAFSGLFQQHV